MGDPNFGAGKDVVKRGLNGNCVEKETPVETSKWQTVFGEYRLGDLRLVPGEAGIPGVRFCIPGMIFQGHGKRTWLD
jgi:hypothetical protein